MVQGSVGRFGRYHSGFRHMIAAGPSLGLYTTATRRAGECSFMRFLLVPLFDLQLNLRLAESRLESGLGGGGFPVVPGGSPGVPNRKGGANLSIRDD